MGVLFSTRLINGLVFQCLFPVSADQSSNGKLSAVIGTRNRFHIKLFLDQVFLSLKYRVHNDSAE